MKWCPKCKQQKLENQFFLNKRNKDKLSDWCKKCNGIANKQYYLLHRKETLIRTKKYYQKNKRWLKEKRTNLINRLKDTFTKSRIPVSKQCSQCKKIKLAKEFHINKRHCDGLCYWCKKCKNQYHSNLYKQNRNKFLERQKKSWKQRQQMWLLYLPKNPKCEICNMPLKYFINNKKGSVIFDHSTDNLPIKIGPASWLGSHLPTSKNIETWKQCDFGILCHNCNRTLPTKNRMNWINKIRKYTKKHLYYIARRRNPLK